MENEIKRLEEEFQKDFQEIKSSKDLEALRIKYLGRKSAFMQLFSRIPTLAKEEKGIWGKKLNTFKNKITSLLESKAGQGENNEEKIDLTAPSVSREEGSRHVLSTVSKEICSIFERLGFITIEGKEIEEEWYNFEALNIPSEHPSREDFDTFYLDIGEKDKGKYLLRSHTSPSQIRVMKESKPPLAVISPGRVYRPDEVDATHSFMFHQIEGFAVAKDMNFAHLKGVLLHFVREFFSTGVELRFRPHFFPFTEPSVEVDISCFICKNKKVEDSKKKCSVCKGKGWLEILGCGMIHPKVLKACGIDFKKYKGFAFGMGVERIAMLKYGINDIRLFYENDVRFLKQFSL
ncbi:MAG: phenylalanine--tRNA ligase subunit alpha [Candidatus Omnitrophica bacterium]|nr:phenylalanine--tRNA ligase subunit alpha [Candidatus Omnitrophota bacterium]